MLLCFVCIINLVKATVEFVEVTPEGPLKDIMDQLEFVEDCLLFWIPSVGVCLIILFLIAKCGNSLIAKCGKCVHKEAD